MEFSVNYTPVLAQLVREGRVRLDRFKCPAWPDLLSEASQTLPVYIHFPLLVGHGSGGAYDTETKHPADLDRLADLLEMTGTPYVNTHFIASQRHYPDIPIDSSRPDHLRRVLDGALRDLEGLVERFGAERVLVENIINEHGWLTASVLPEVLGRLLEESGCGFLFDLSHAQLTAENLNLDSRAYSAALPVEQVREIHVTGLQVLEGALLDLMVAIGDPYGYAADMAGRRIDHLPMTEADWPELAWMLGEITAGRWAAPWVVSYEYGGVGRFWEEVTDREVYLDQLPRMAEMIAVYNR
jgi:uncharacterized protein